MAGQFKDWYKVMAKFNERNHTCYTNPEKMIRQLMDDHDNYSDVSFLLHVPFSTMRRKLKAMGYENYQWATDANVTRLRVRYNKDNHTRHPDNKIFIENMYKRFNSSNLAGEEIGVSLTTFLSYLDYYGIQKNGRGGPRKIKCYRKEIQELAVDGRTAAKIAKMVGCSKVTAATYMREIGLLPSGKPRKEKGK